VREESHLNDMRAAIRGDFERLAKRRGTQELMQEPEVAAEPEPRQDPEPRLEAESIDTSTEPPAAVEVTQEDIVPGPHGSVEEPTESPVEEAAPVEQAAPVEEAASLDELPAEGAPPEETADEELPRRGFLARLLGL
jgi:hypothetical protein